MISELARKHILITGGTGFLGKQLVKELMDYKTRITIIDKKMPLARQFEKLIKKKGIQFIGCDLTKKSDIKQIKREIKDSVIVIHLAAFVPISGNQHEDLIEKSTRVNIEGTINLVTSISDLLQKICYVSTLDAYGNPVYMPVDEQHPTNPLSYYGASKLATEKYLQVFSLKSKIPLTILRLSCTYGPGEWYERAMPNFIRAAIDKKPLVIYGDGSDVRDYLYLDDAIRAIVLALRKNSGGLYNIGSGRGYTIKEVAKKIIELTGGTSSIQFRPRLRKRTKFIFDISRAQKELSYLPQAKLEDGLKREIAWFKTTEPKSEYLF